MRIALNRSMALGLVLGAGAAAPAQQYVPLEKVFATNDNGAFAPASGSLDGTQQWVHAYMENAGCETCLHRSTSSALGGGVPAIDAAGNVAFSALLQAGVGGVLGGIFDSATLANGFNQFTFWYGGPGNLSLQARYGDPTLDNPNCGGSGALFLNRYAYNVSMSPAGYMYIGGYEINGGITTTSDRNVMWMGLPGNLRNFIRANDLYPFLDAGTSQQTGNITSAQNSMPRINNLGQSVFFGQTRPGVGDTTNNAYPALNNNAFIGVCTSGQSPFDSALGYGVNSGARKVARRLDDILGTGSQVTSFQQAAFNHSAEVFNGYGLVQNVGGVSPLDDYLLVFSSPQGNAYTHTIIGREGGPTGIGAIRYAVAPNTGTGTLVDPVTPHSPFAMTGGQAMNNDGRVIWVANLMQGAGGIDASNDAAIMSWKDGVTSIVVQKGPASAIDASLPGALVLGVSITGLGQSYGNVSLSNADQVAWVGTLSGGGVNYTNDNFLAVSSIAPDGSVRHQLIVREGDQIPDGPPGMLWGGHDFNSSPQYWSGPGNVAINAAGHVVFATRVQGTGITEGVNDFGLWAFYPTCAKSRLVAKLADTIVGISLTKPDGGWGSPAIQWSNSPNGEGSSHGLNDEGWFAFAINDGFSDGRYGVIGDGAIVRFHFRPADLDDGGAAGQPDGGIDINDLLYFLTQYELGLCGADLDGGAGNGLPDGGVDINDLLFFLAHYEGGC